MEFKVGDKIYAKIHQYHGLELINEREFYEKEFETIPINMNGTRLVDCNTEWHKISYLKKNYVPVSKIRKQKLENIFKYEE